MENEFLNTAKPGEPYTSDKKKFTSKILLLVPLIFTLSNAFCQYPDKTKKYNNDIEIDASGLLLQFTNKDFLPKPAYYIGYRRSFKNFNIRSAVGGDYFENIPNETDKQKSTQYNIRLGIERVCKITDRFLFFYGFDLQKMLSKQTTVNFDSDIWIISTPQGTFTTQSTSYTSDASNRYGAGPLLGARLVPIPRIFISIETNFVFFSEKSQYSYNTTFTNQQLTSPDKVNYSVKRVSTKFELPTAIKVAFKF